MTPHATTSEPSSRAAAVLVGVGFGLVTPLVGAVLSTVAMERYVGEGHLANFVPIVLVTATAALLGPLLMLLVGAFSRSRESLRLLATACLAGALTWVVVVLLEVSALIAKTVWLSAAIDGSNY